MRDNNGRLSGEKKDNEGSAGGSSRPSVNRRSFLRKSTGTAFGVGSVAVMPETVITDSNVDAAKLRKAMEAYNTRAEVRRSLKAHSSELLQILTNEGILASPSIDDLPVEELKDPAEYGKSAQGTTVSVAKQDGTATAHIMISTTTNDHDVLIVVQPQVGRSYAIVEQAGESSSSGQTGETTSEQTIYDPDRDDVTINTCMTGPVCKVCRCDINYCGICEYEVHCCDTTCYWGEKLGNWCMGEDYEACCNACNIC